LINAVICDAPAKTFMKCVKGHTGYYGYDKCEVEVEWRENRMLFLDENASLRTDEKFLLRHNEDHHLNDSPFESRIKNGNTVFLGLHASYLSRCHENAYKIMDRRNKGY